MSSARNPGPRGEIRPIPNIQCLMKSVVIENSLKILEKMSGYQDDLNKVVVEQFPYENIPDRPQYYNHGYKFLFTGQDGVEFKGIFSLDQPELKLPTEQTAGTYEFYTTSRTYAVFKGYENKRIYAIPVIEKVKCYVDTNYGKVKMANVCNLTFNVNYGVLSVGEMEINTVNICGNESSLVILLKK
ncbi:hypothetical protein CHM_8g10 [Cryptosporidium hominis]